MPEKLYTQADEQTDLRERLKAALRLLRYQEPTGCSTSFEASLPEASFKVILDAIMPILAALPLLPQPAAPPTIEELRDYVQRLKRFYSTSGLPQGYRNAVWDIALEIEHDFIAPADRRSVTATADPSQDSERAAPYPSEKSCMICGFERPIGIQSILFPAVYVCADCAKKARASTPVDEARVREWLTEHGRMNQNWGDDVLIYSARDMIKNILDFAKYLSEEKS